MGFPDALEIVESLPEPQQDELLEIIRRRRRERRRDALADRIAEARTEYDHGEVERGIVDDLMESLASRWHPDRPIDASAG